MKPLICASCGIATLHLVANGLKAGVCQECHAGRGLMLPPVASGAPTLDVIHNCDALHLLKALPDGSIDLILTDPPYGMHEATWDKTPDLVVMFKEMKRVIRNRGAIVMTGAEPFASRARLANIEQYKYDWIWQKSLASNFLNAPNRPLTTHELIMVFSPGTIANGSSNLMTYFPQGTREVSKWQYRPYSSKYRRDSEQIVSTRANWKNRRLQTTTDYPKSILYFPSGNNKTLHPNQKPTSLFEYLIQTYTRPGELVLDPFAGSGTTAIAARKTGRHFICGDSSAEYVAMAKKRLATSDPFLSREVAPGLVQKSLFAGMSL